MSEADAITKEPPAQTEFRKIATKDEAANHEIEISVDCEWYKVWFVSEVDYHIRLVRTPAYVVNDEHEVHYVNGMPVTKVPFDAALDAWAMVGPEDYTLMFVQLGAATVLTLKEMDQELLRRSEQKAG